MKKQKLIGLSLLLIIPFFHSNAEEGVMELQKKICTEPPIVFEDEACSGKNFFKKDVAPKIENINDMFQKNLDEVFHDNQAHHEFMVQNTINDFRIYHYCFEDLCDKVYQNCSSSNANINPLDEFNWCKNRQAKLELLQKRKMHYVMVHNVERKNRSLLEEKINALGYRFNQFIHPKMKEINSALDKAIGSIGTFLIMYPRS